jgi:SAM-dependent methyltransferase
VIEHLRDPAEALAECRRLLRPGGRLALATPNAASRGSRRFGARWRGFEPPRHLQVYEPRSLRTLCERAGFAVTELATPAPAAVPIWLASQRTSGVLATGRATLFWLREWFDVWRGQEVGEEILLLAHAAAPAGVTR